MIVDRDARVEQILEIPFDVVPYLPDSYYTFADDATETMTRTLHKGIALVAMQESLMMAEHLSVAAPDQAIPYRHRIWLEVTSNAQGEVTLIQPPWAIIGVKETLSADDDWVNAASYDRTTGTISGLAPDTTYWVPEARHYNPWVWSKIAAPLGFGEEHFPLGYGPEHLVQLLRVVRAGMRQGSIAASLRALASALSGNPFAYVAGTVTAHAANHIVVTQEDGTETRCWLPEGQGAGSLTLVPVSTEVGLFEPLVVNGASVALAGKTERVWDSPIEVSSASGEQLTLASNPGAGHGDRLRVRVLSSGFEAVYLVRNAKGSQVRVEGPVPTLSGGEYAFAQRLSADPEPSLAISVVATSSYGNARKAAVETFVERALPSSVTADITTN
jgi:hypothetical protein